MLSNRNSRVIAPLLVSLCVFAPAIWALDAFPAEDGGDWADFDHSGDGFEFEDRPLEEELGHPEWFKLSFLDLPDDLEEAVDDGKKGLVVYFGQKHCAYCKALMEVNFGREDIVSYFRTHFDIVPIDIWGDRPVTDMGGAVQPEKQYSVREKTNFTPSLIFYDEEGKEALRLRGYYPPYKFRAALHYVVEGFYRNESFREYLERADPGMTFEPDGLNANQLFSPPPHALAREPVAGERPLAVFFEQGECHSCDLLHTGPLADETVSDTLELMDTVQLDIWSSDAVLTPAGTRTTARDWAHELSIFYTPTIVFFDEWGGEILRVDSVVQLYRLRSVLEYVISEAYLEEPNFQRWRDQQSHVPDLTGRADSQ